MTEVLSEVVNVADKAVDNTAPGLLVIDSTGDIKRAEKVNYITKSAVGLGNVDNTSDANKPISSATQTALDLKLAILQLDTALAAKSAVDDGIDSILVIRDGAVQRYPFMQPTVNMFNAVADGVADDTPAWEAWHTYHENNNTKFRPIGVGIFKLTTGTTYAITNDCAIVGEGMGITTVIHNDASAQNLFSFPTPLDRISIRDITFKGSHNANRSFLSAYPCYVYNTTDVVIRNVEVAYSRVMGIVVRQADRVTVTGCHVHHCARDGINTANCSEAVIVENRVNDVDDDAIAVHNQVYSYQRGHVIANNKIRKAQGIKALGIQGATIIGNTLEFFFSHGITVRSSTLDGVELEGVNATVAVNIIGNTLLDGFNRDALDSLNTSGHYMSISSQSAQAGSLSDIPGLCKTPGFDLPYTYFENVAELADNVSTTPIPSSQRIMIHSNIFGKTLKETGVFSDYGFGLFWLRDGELDIDLTDTANTRITGIKFSGSNAIKGVSVKNNVVYGIGDFVSFEPIAVDGSEILAEGNEITDCLSVHTNVGTGSTTQRFIWRNNIIDLDPYHRSTGRNTDGSWTAANHRQAFVMGGIKGLELYNNRFRNLSQISSADIGTTFLNGTLLLDGNIIECDPDTLNSFSAVNKGVGVIPQMGGFNIIYMDCNPNSATYGIINNMLLSQHNAQPSSGKYVKGWFTRNYNPSSSNGNVLLGWIRLTTGSAHVAGTDWEPVYTDRVRLVGTKTYDPASIAAGAWGATTTVTVTGAVAGDYVEAVSHSSGAALMWVGQVTGADTVTVAPFNPTGSPIDAASANIRVIVKKI